MHNIKLRATLPNDKKEETSQNINNQFIAWHEAYKYLKLNKLCYKTGDPIML
jgi:hypothetical protein